MKLTIMQPVEIEVSHIKITVPLHEPEDFAGLPGLTGNLLVVTIEMDTGKVVEWPEGLQAEFEVYDKVRDTGIYQLIAPDGKILATRDDYVPDDAIPGEYGDYLDLKIKDGIVTNWYKKPKLHEFFGGEEE